MAETKRKHIGLTVIKGLILTGLIFAHEYEYAKRYGNDFVLYPVIFFVASFVISSFWFYWLLISKMTDVYDFDVPRDATSTVLISYRDDFIKKIISMAVSVSFPIGFYCGWKFGYLVDELIEWLGEFVPQIAMYLYHVGGT